MKKRPGGANRGEKDGRHGQHRRGERAAAAVRTSQSRAPGPGESTNPDSQLRPRWLTRSKSFGAKARLGPSSLNTAGWRCAIRRPNLLQVRASCIFRVRHPDKLRAEITRSAGRYRSAPPRGPRPSGTAARRCRDRGRRPAARSGRRKRLRRGSSGFGG